MNRDFVAGLVGLTLAIAYYAMATTIPTSQPPDEAGPPGLPKHYARLPGAFPRLPLRRALPTVPRPHVAEAIARLSALGTITSEQVDIQDKQAGLNATDRKIARLQTQLKALNTQPQSAATTARIAILEAQIARLQRAEATTRPHAHSELGRAHV